MSEKPPHVITEHGRYNLDPNGNYSSGENSISASAADAISQGMAIDAARQGYVDRIASLRETQNEAEKYREAVGTYPKDFNADAVEDSIKYESENLKKYDKEVASIYGLKTTSNVDLKPLAGGIAAFGKFALPFGEFAISLAFLPIIWGVRGINKLRGKENEPASKPLLAATGVYAIAMGASILEDQKHTPPRVTYPAYSAPANIPQSGYQPQPSSPAAPVEQPRYRDTRALTEQFYRAVPAGAAYYELYQVSQTKYDLAYKRTIIDGRCIEVTDGHEGIETAAVRIPAPWKDGGVMEGYIYKDELVPAPECKPAGP